MTTELASTFAEKIHCYTGVEKRNDCFGVLFFTVKRTDKGILCYDLKGLSVRRDAHAAAFAAKGVAHRGDQPDCSLCAGEAVARGHAVVRNGLQLRTALQNRLRREIGAKVPAAIRRGILMKPERHHMDETGETEAQRGMFAIGG